ncbi:unnamed protein product, partial [Ixodes hexagonus]
SQIVTGALESVEIVPPTHTFCYKIWVVCTSLCILGFIPLSLTFFAVIRKSPKLASRVPPTTDPNWLTYEGQSRCDDQFPLQRMHMGTPRTMDSQVFCLFNTSVHSRPYVSRFTVGMVPGALCHHVLYYTVTANTENELATKNPEFDYECRGLDSVAKLKKRFAAMKVHLVLSAETSSESARLSLTAIDIAAMNKLVESIRRWADRYKFDGIFVNWVSPLLPVWNFFDALNKQLRPNYTVGVILPREGHLTKFNVSELFQIVDWMIATTHGFISPETSKVTSCYTPFTNNARGGMKSRIDLVYKELGSSVDPTRFCFTVSPRTIGFKVEQQGQNYSLKPTGPGDLNRYTGIPGVLSYSQVCRLGQRTTIVPRESCVYMR